MIGDDIERLIEEGRRQAHRRDGRLAPHKPLNGRDEASSRSHKIPTHNTAQEYEHSKNSSDQVSNGSGDRHADASHAPMSSASPPSKNDHDKRNGNGETGTDRGDSSRRSRRDEETDRLSSTGSYKTSSRYRRGSSASSHDRHDRRESTNTSRRGDSPGRRSRSPGDRMSDRDRYRDRDDRGHRSSRHDDGYDRRRDYDRREDSYDRRRDDGYRSYGRNDDRRYNDGYGRSGRGGNRSYDRSPVRDRRGGDRTSNYGRDDRHRRGGRNGAPDAPVATDIDERTVFVRQVAISTTESQVKRFFNERAGEVKNVTMVQDRRGMHRGIGYVEFLSKDSVEKALDLTGQHLRGVPLIVSLTEAEKNRVARSTQPSLSNSVPFHKLYVGNIHFNVTESDLEDIFSQYGEVEIVQLTKDETTGKSRGFGSVQFTKPEDARAALAELNGFQLAGRPIRVGLGNDKLNQEATVALQQQRLGQSNPEEPGSSFSGSGGRGGQAGNAPKKQNGLSALDDSEIGEVNYNNYNRENLMRLLARDEDPAAASQNAAKDAQAKPKKAPVAAFKPSRCILIKNVYDESQETEPNWDKEIEEDFADECGNYGEVVHCAVPMHERSEGAVYIKFKEVKGGDNALKSLNGRLFGGRYIRAEPVLDAIYESHFPKTKGL